MSTLYEHQDAGSDWLAQRARAYLGDTPGLGKTRTLIAAMQRTGTNRRALVVCPAIVRSHWYREAQALGLEPARNITVKSYDEITRGGVALMRELVPDVDTLILDEAHYLKHPTSQRTKMLLGVDGYARRLPHVYLASGTPMPRNPAELWPAIAALFPESAVKRGIRTKAEFVARYCIVRGSYVRGAWREKVIGVKTDNLPELQEMVGEFMLRRTLDDVGLDVPRIDWQVTRLDGGRLDAEDTAWMQSSVREAGVVGSIPGYGQRVEFMDGVLEEIAADPHVARMRRRLGELKAPLVVEMLKTQLEADPNMRVAVFAHHRTVLGELRSGLVDFAPAYVDGNTHHRDVQIDAFVNVPECRVFIGQNIACQTGMDGLQHATNRAVLVEPDWTPDVNYQLGHRVARIGAQYQGRAIVQMIALAGTLDEAIIAQNARETRMVEAAMAAREAA